MYVLDTNTLIYFFKGMGHVADRLFDNPPSAIGLPSIVLFEVKVGIAKSTSPVKRRRQLDHLALGPRSKIRFKFEKRGLIIAPYDILIAGIARSVQGILVTHNTGEFERVEGFKIEDWY